MGEFPALHEEEEWLRVRAVFRGLFGVLHKVPNWLFPPLCAGCEVPVSRVGTLCGHCWCQIRFLELPMCPVMGTPFTHDFGSGLLCAEAIAEPPSFRRLRSVATHEGAARHASIALKYYDRLDMGPWMAQWMLRAGQELLDDCDLILPVPLHRKRLWQRRYNQAAELARALARQSGKIYEPDAIKRIKNTSQQAQLSQSERLRNVAGAFQVPENQQIKVQGRNILLIDDVYTTGATVKAVSSCLLKAGANSVDVLTFSRVLPDHAKSPTINLND